jgi:prepilin-type N-terminal cleavage/methylation domain-containing protein
MRFLEKKAFTLIELLVVIALVSILTLAITNINWNSLNDKQHIDIFSKNIVSSFEEIRNNSLL